MNLLSVSGLSKSFGDRTLFRNISFGISYGDKVALVARNGSGKTTLFRILKGVELADEGEVVFRKDLRIAFLDQDFSLAEDSRISEVLHAADNPMVKATRRYAEAVRRSESGNAQNADELHDALEEMNALEAWDYEKKMKEILARLSITDLDAKISSLSGGQKKRVALAIMLISNPGLLIMDEPTNHLDIDMIEWLEAYLKSASISLLLVTHDRYFLDTVCDRILELDNQALFEYRGDFENYLTRKAEREMSFEAETDRARNLYRRELEWIRKMPKARGTKARARVNAFDDVKARAFVRRQEQKVSLDVKMERLGSKIVELHRISKQYGDRPLFRNFSYTFMTGEKVGLVGKNGSGKSTLLKIIQGLESPDTGKVQRGETVVFGYYSQAGIQISGEKRIIEVVKEIAEYIPLSNGASLSASQLLNRFNFPPARQYTYVSLLSGGEKRRLYLLTVLAKNPNFLILDEPSNDLDLPTLQVLEEFLGEFKGCVLIASHDRYLLDRLAEHTFALEGDGEVKDFPGGYTAYREWKEEARETTKTLRTLSNTKGDMRGTSGQVQEADSSRQSAGDNQQAASEKKRSFKIQRELEQLEAEIPVLEERKMRLADELSSGLSDYNEIQRLSEELAAVEKELEEKTMRWMEIQEM